MTALVRLTPTTRSNRKAGPNRVGPTTHHEASAAVACEHALTGRNHDACTTRGRSCVNALAPGFVVDEQNRALLLNPDGILTARGEAIINHTPAGRFGEAEELLSTFIFLCSSVASFLNGVVVPVDDGFAV